jgi:hypothetical protein
MRKALATLALALALTLSFAVPSHAQTTYSSNTAFYCDMASGYPVTSFEQFSCRGITYKNTDVTTALEFFFQGGIPRNWVELYQTTPLVYGQGAVLEVTAFTLPNPLQPEPGVITTPGRFAFNWTMTDEAGGVHTGTVSGTWENFHVCGGRGCRWWAPELISNSITITK